jgi:hypothetical protein
MPVYLSMYSCKSDLICVQHRYLMLSNHEMLSVQHDQHDQHDKILTDDRFLRVFGVNINVKQR